MSINTSNILRKNRSETRASIHDDTYKNQGYNLFDKTRMESKHIEGNDNYIVSTKREDGRVVVVCNLKKQSEIMTRSKIRNKLK